MLIREIVFVLVILKLPVAYVCWVIWWAVKAEPELGETAAPTASRGGRGATRPARPEEAAERPARQPDPLTRAHTPTRKEDDGMSGGNGSDVAGGIFGVASLVLGVLAFFFVPFALRSAWSWCAS